jgi:pimeloyl-ACP methyl ester carboxylesterase
MHTRLYAYLVVFAIAGCDGQTHTIRVYENRASHSGRQIDLHVVVLPARGRPVEADPVVVLTGGPGAAAAAAARDWARMTRLRAHRDIVLLDQRGTGKSAPLFCHLYDTGRLQPFLDPMFPLDRVRSCRAQLERQADLTQYTTDIAADDLDQVLSTLGYARANFFGISYGTRAALVFLRRHPDRVRSIIATAVLPPDRVPFDYPAAIVRALAAADTGHVVDTAMARLRRAPVTVTLWNWPHLRRETVTMTARGFAERMFSMLYVPSRGRRAVGLVRQGLAGDWVPFVKAAIFQSRWQKEGRWTGMTLSVLCTGDAERLARADTARLAATGPLGLPIAYELVAACAEWPHGAVSVDDTLPVTSTAPVLFLSGGLDPGTPPEWADSAAAHLPNSRHIVDPTAGHGFLTDETMARIAAFIDSP